MKQKQTIKRGIALALTLAMIFSLRAPVWAQEQGAENTDGLTGWTLNGEGTALTGNPEAGWQLTLIGDPWQNHTAVYETAIDVSKLQMHFNLSEMPEGSNLRVQFGDKAYNFNYNTNASMNLVLENFDNKNLRMYGYKNDTVIGLKDMEFDFTKDHVLEFVQENGNWVPAVDGAAIGTDASFNTFIETMSTTSAGKTTVRFYEAAANGTYVIKNINFSENTDDLTGWTVGATSTMTGNPTDGWKIDFYGVRDVSYGTSYAAGIDVSKLQVKFNLSDLPTGKSIVLQLGKEKGSFEAEDTTRVNFALERIADNKLRFNGYDGNRYTSVVYNLHDFDFNYNENHVLTFEQQDGKWLPAIDGTIQIWPDNPSDIEAYDTFVRTMMTESAGQTVVSFAPNDAYGAKLTVKNINFTEKPAILLGNTATLDGTIGFNYYMALSKELQGNSNVSMKFTYGNGIVQEVPINEAIHVEGKDEYIFTCKLPAKHMADEVTAQLFVGEEAKSDGYKLSVKSYGNAILNDGGTTEEIKTLVRNMLHYGAAAQKYFKYNQDNLADVGLNDEFNIENVIDVDQTKFSDAHSKSILTADGIGKIVGSNLYLKGETDLKVYIELADGVSANSLTFTCNGTELTTGTYSRNGTELVTVTIPNIAAHELQNVWEIKIANVDGTTGTLSYSAFTYAYNALADSYNPDMTNYGMSIKDLMKVMYKYNEAACAVK